MKKEKNNKRKKYKMTKKTWIILSIVLVVIGLGISLVIYMNSEIYEKNKLEKTVTNWAEEYYTEFLCNKASSYVKEKAEKGENININLKALKDFGKNVEIIKNTKTKKECDEFGTYVYISVDKDASDIKKEYKIDKVVLDCFD